MAKFVAIAGPSSTGKTTLVEYLSTYPELSRAVFSPDLYETVWKSLVEQGHFSEFVEVSSDSEYLSIYILKLLEYYENYINTHKDSDKLIILDGCWLDLSIYALINMWYTRPIRGVQEEILAKINRLNDTVSRIYLTESDPTKHTKDIRYAPFRMPNAKLNRELELLYYQMSHNLMHTRVLPSSDLAESSLFIIDDLRTLGHL